MNETLIFQAIERLREIVKSASNKTKSARRQYAKTIDHLKKDHLVRGNSGLINSCKDESSKKPDSNCFEAFKDVEVW